MDWKEWIGKRIFVKLRDGSVYTGIVKDVDNEWFKITDKFSEAVTFPISEILKIKEESFR